MNLNRTRPALTAAERHSLRTGVIARQLDQIAPGTTTVRTVPVHIDDDRGPRTRTWVTLDNALGQPIEADRDAHRAAARLLRSMFPGVDWTGAIDYDAITGRITAPAAPAMPAMLMGDAR